MTGGDRAADDVLARGVAFGSAAAAGGLVAGVAAGATAGVLGARVAGVAASAAAGSAAPPFFEGALKAFELTS